MNRAVLATLLLLVLLGSTSLAQAAPCDMTPGLNSSGRGHDFRDPQEAGLLSDVEKFHFQPYTENLTRGTSSPLPLDINYVLRWYTNHYRALNAMAQWQLAHPMPANGEYFEMECYFMRAAQFTPDDPVIFTIWGNFLYKKKDMAGALEKYQHAEKLDANSAEIQYNLGLVYVELNDYDNAKKHADRAYELGHTLPGLRRKLERMKGQAGLASTK